MNNWKNEFTLSKIKMKQWGNMKFILSQNREFICGYSVEYIGPCMRSFMQCSLQ